MNCSRCGSFMFSGFHTCVPLWDVWKPDHGQIREDCKPIRAPDARSAVETWAERDDCESADYSIVGGSPATVLVAEHGKDDEPEQWVVDGETVPSYNARKVEK